MASKDRVELLLLRHADAGDSATWAGPDAERPLSLKGREQAGRLGEHLRRAAYRVDVIISSPKVRAAQTAEIVATALGLPVTLDDRLAESLDPAMIDAILADHGRPARPMLVGHDPAFSDAVVQLTGGDTSLKKGALARVDLEGSAADGGTLRALLAPDLLPER